MPLFSPGCFFSSRTRFALPADNPDSTPWVIGPLHPAVMRADPMDSGERLANPPSPLLCRDIGAAYRTTVYKFPAIRDCLQLPTNRSALKPAGPPEGVEPAIRALFHRFAMTRGKSPHLLRRSFPPHTAGLLFLIPAQGRQREGAGFPLFRRSLIPHGVDIVEAVFVLSQNRFGSEKRRAHLGGVDIQDRPVQPAGERHGQKDAVDVGPLR